MSGADVAVVAALVGMLAGVVAVLVAVLATRSRRRRRTARGPSSARAVGERQPMVAMVVNPSKFGDVRPLRRTVETACRELGWAEPLWLETTEDDPGGGQTRQAVEADADLVVACGGDGTVRCVAQVLAGTGRPMGLLPAGTGNLLARNLDLALDDPAWAIRAALTGTDRRLDVGWVRAGSGESEPPADEVPTGAPPGDRAGVRGTERSNGAAATHNGGSDTAEVAEVAGAGPPEQAFLVMAGLGFDAAVMAGAPEALKARVGPFAYFVSGLRQLRGRHARVTITVDGGPPVHRRVRTVLVGNVGTLIGGLTLMPDARVDDGWLDGVTIAPEGLVGWAAVAGRVLTRRRHGHPRVEHWRGRRIVLTTEQPEPAQLDGDTIGDVRVLQVRVDPGALVLRVPSRGPGTAGGTSATPAQRDS